MKVLAKIIDNVSIQLLPASEYSIQYTPKNPVIGFAFDPQYGSHSFASNKVSPYKTPPNSLAYTPEGCEIYSTSPVGGEYLTINMNREEFSNLTAYKKMSLSSFRFNDHINPKAISIAQEIRKMLLSNDNDAISYQVSVSELIDCICSKHDNSFSPHSAGRSMTPGRLKLLYEKIESDLSETITLDQLAELVGLSKGFFIRAFKASTGMQPHKYLIARRIARARMLLIKRDSLTEIALDTGFSNHAHLTTAFKKHLGITPSQYRTIAAA